MNMKIAVLITAFIAGGAVFANDMIPRDVQVFIKNAEACDHFAGEFDGGLSDKRQREIERSVVQYCQPAQKQLKQLKVKYKRDPRMSKFILRHANDSVTSFR